MHVERGWAVFLVHIPEALNSFYKGSGRVPSAATGELQAEVTALEMRNLAVLLELSYL